MKQFHDDILPAGVNDHVHTLFEGQYAVPDGMTYNSYVILDEKSAVLDTVDFLFGDEWLANVAARLDGRAPDFLVVHHMEPDHSANIARFLDAYPSARLVGNAKTLAMARQFFSRDFSERALVVKDGDCLELGRHSLRFICAPMVHWPEVMVSYDEAAGILFSADAFGTFGADDVAHPKPWADEARRYYIGIVGKFGAAVQALLKKAAALDIRMICPLHGPVLQADIPQCVNLYNVWSSYAPETDGVLIAYASVYGNTERAARLLERQLRESGCAAVQVMNLIECDMSEAVAQSFRYSRTVFAATTYNASVFPAMSRFLEILAEHNFSNRTVGFIENGSWAPAAAKVMKERLAGCKNLTVLEPVVTVKSALDDASEAQVEALCRALLLR
ncbi:MAG: FprA family A-type flavoprotein [Treponemataceae bacterium]|nr:FprA family A-type flavoprotein [Treponemataceae bacterium]